MNILPIKPDVTFEQFAELDLRIGTITQVDDVPDSRKLVKLHVDFGDHKRTIIVGMKQEREDPSEITGLQALFILNLPEKEIAGQLSQGMLVDVGYANGITPCLLTPEKPIPNGASAG